MPKRKSKQARVSVWVPAGNDQIDFEIPLKTWRRVVAGEHESCGRKAVLDGFEGWVSLGFNGDGYGSLYATYGHDGGELYIGDLGDGESAIQIDGEEIAWSELKRPETPAPPKRVAPRRSSSPSRTSGKKSSEKALSAKGRPRRAKGKR